MSEAALLTHRLALGIAPRDALRRPDLVVPVAIEIEHGLPHRSGGRTSYVQRRDRPPDGLLRHASGRYALHYHPGIAETVVLRIAEAGRVYGPRRLRIPLVTLAQVLARETAEAPDYLAGRVRQPVLFPGAAYPLSGGMGLRGRVRRADGSLVRWAHLVLAEPQDDGGPDRIVARSRSDDRGEFLLLLPPWATLARDLAATLDLELTVWAPAAPPVPVPTDLPGRDPLWDLPLETVAAAPPDDPVSTGRTPPPGHVAMAPLPLTFTIGRILTPWTLGDVVFVPP